jgi:DNA-directed RNA polymerase specialized sigma24 family protein
VNLSIENLEHFEFTTEELFQFKELQLVIAHEVNGLPERMMEIYPKSRIENLQNAEIAATLKISEQTVKNTLTTALKGLRGSLSKYNCLFIILL